MARDLKELLTQLVDEQLEESVRIPRPSPEAFLSDDTLIQEFSATEMYQALPKELAQSLSQIKREDLNPRVRGRLFQELAFWTYSTLNTPDSSLLSPSRTLILFSDMFPGREIVNNPFALDSISGKSPADGVLSENGRIVAQYEYSVAAPTRKIALRADFFKREKTTFTELYDKEATFHFITIGDLGLIRRSPYPSLFRGRDLGDTVLEELVVYPSLEALSKNLIEVARLR